MVCPKKKEDNTMEFKQDIFIPFFEELMELYRKNILKQNEPKVLANRQRELSQQVQEYFHGPSSTEYKLIEEFIGCIYDLSSIYQEQLYIQGIKDGIKLKKLMEEIEKEENAK